MVEQLISLVKAIAGGEGTEVRTISFRSPDGATSSTGGHVRPHVFMKRSQNNPPGGSNH